MSYPKPLLQLLSIAEYEYGSTLSLEICERIANLANIDIDFNQPNTPPGKALLNHLHRGGCTLEQYKSYLNRANILTFYSPESKVAILIANDKYEQLSKLATPSLDCESLGSILRNLGFITVIICNTNSSILKNILTKTIGLIPEDSYCFFFYAGHGCELINTKCILSTDCPSENISFDHCVTENWLLKESARCKPDLCILIMDMCRVNLDRHANPQIYSAIPQIEEYEIYNNLIITYATQSSNAAYEFVLIEKEETIGGSSYSLQPSDVVCGGASQYVNALCSRLNDNVDINTMLDKIHGDMENSTKKQRPIKVQCGISKRGFNDPVNGDTKQLLMILREALEQFKENCTVL